MRDCGITMARCWRHGHGGITDGCYRCCYCAGNNVDPHKAFTVLQARKGNVLILFDDSVQEL